VYDRMEQPCSPAYDCTLGSHMWHRIRKHANTLSLAIKNIFDIRSVLLEIKIDNRLPTELKLMRSSTTTFKHHLRMS